MDFFQSLAGDDPFIATGQTGNGKTTTSDKVFSRYFRAA